VAPQPDRGRIRPGRYAPSVLDGTHRLRPLRGGRGHTPPGPGERRERLGQAARLLRPVRRGILRPSTSTSRRSSSARSGRRSPARSTASVSGTRARASST